MRPLRVQLHPNVPAGTDPEAAQQLGHLDADISVVVEPRQEAPATLAPAVEEATSPRVACMTAAPWLTHDGRLNATLWKALAARAVEAVAARPGEAWGRRYPACSCAAARSLCWKRADPIL